MGLAVDALSWIFLGSGSLVLLAATWGILRMPTFYTRVHAASVNETLGSGLLLTGLALQSEGNWELIIKLFLIAAFQAFTGPIAAHALSRAAYLYGLEPGQYSRIRPLRGRAGKRQREDDFDQDDNALENGPGDDGASQRGSRDSKVRGNRGAKPSPS